MIRVTLEFPKTMSAADLFQALYDAGAATTGNPNRRPTLVALEHDAESLNAFKQLESRLAERGIRVPAAEES